MSFADRDGVIWMDGEFVPWREATTHVLTHSLHYGVGVFEGVRAYKTEQGPSMFRLHDHTERLFRSAKIMGMDVPFNADTLNQVQKEIIPKNNLRSAYLRPFCFYGSENMGLHAGNLKTHVVVATWEWGAYLGAEALEKGIRVKISSFARHHVNSSMCKAKTTGHYYNSIMALQEAEACGYDEALLLDTDGYVAEGSGENIFLVRNGKLLTPELDSALEGITRDTVAQLAHEQGLEIREKRITRDEVYVADEVFFTGTAAEITPIREVDGRIIGNGARGPVTEQLQTQYFDLVHGRSDQHREWLTLV